MAKSILLILTLAVSAGSCTTGPNNPIPSAPSSIIAPATPPTTPAPPALAPMQLSLAASPSPGTAGSLVHLSTWTSGGAPVGAVTYTWTFGDGQMGTSTEATVNHIYAGKGTFAARVQATDSTDRTAAATMTVGVQGAPAAAAEPTPAAPVAPTLSVSLNCTQPTAPARQTFCNLASSYGGTALSSSAIQNGAWDWGTGISNNIAGPSASYTYAQPGVWVIVVDAQAQTVDGLKTGRATKTLTIN